LEREREGVNADAKNALEKRVDGGRKPAPLEIVVHGGGRGYRAQQRQPKNTKSHGFITKGRAHAHTALIAATS
jgi:hypothetical protein